MAPPDCETSGLQHRIQDTVFNHRKYPAGKYRPDLEADNVPKFEVQE